MLIVITRATAKKISQCHYANQTEIGYFLYIFSQPVAWFALSLSSLCFPPVLLLSWKLHRAGAMEGGRHCSFCCTHM